MTLSYNLAYQETILVHPTSKASDFCWQTILEFPQHLRMTHIYFESKGFHLWNLLLCMNKLCLVGQMYFVSPDSFTVEPCYEKKLLIGSSDPVTDKYI